jgi:recombination protein RecT
VERETVRRYRSFKKTKPKTKMSTDIQKSPLTAKALFNQDNIKKKFEEMMGKKAQGFITSVLQIVSSSDLLSKADPMSVYNAAAVAATLDLPLNNNLGFAYIVPYNQSYKDEKGVWQKKQVAQFQMGYKGFVQLAQRSGVFKTISATPIYEGQLIEENPLTGFVFDFTKKKSEKLIGFASYFSLINGFEKTFYMSLEQMNAHGLRFSKTFKDGLWKTDLVGMGNKTVLKLLLSKFAPLSIEMQKATIMDQAVINDHTTEDITYVDNEVVEIDKEAERIQFLIADCLTIEDIEALQEANPEIDVTLFDAQKEKIKVKQIKK